MWINRKSKELILVALVLISSLVGVGRAEQDNLERFEVERTNILAAEKNSRKAEAKAMAALKNAREIKKAADASKSPNAGKAQAISAQAVAKAEQALDLARSQRETAEKGLAAVEKLLFCEQERRLEIRLSALRDDLEAVKVQFSKLDKSVQSDQAAFKEWAKVSDQAVTAARKDSLEMLSEATLDYMLKRLEPMEKKIKAGIAEADSEILRAGAKNAPAVKLLKMEKQKLLKEQGVLNGLREANDAVARLEEFRGGDEPEQLNEMVYGKLTEALNSEMVQKAIGIGENMGGYAKFAKYVVDYAYNVTAFSCSYNRINQLDQNSDQHLKAVKKLSGRMKTVVKDIDKTKKDLSAARAGCKL